MQLFGLLLSAISYLMLPSVRTPHVTLQETDGFNGSQYLLHMIQVPSHLLFASSGVMIVLAAQTDSQRMQEAYVSYKEKLGLPISSFTFTVDIPGQSSRTLTLLNNSASSSMWCNITLKHRGVIRCEALAFVIEREFEILHKTR